MINIKFNEQDNILESTWTGDVDLKQIVEYIDRVRLNKDLPRKLKIFSDSRQANLLLKPEELNKIVEANLKSLEQYDTIIDALLPANPHDTAVSFLYLKLSATKKYFFEVFSTSEAAFEWLKNY